MATDPRDWLLKWLSMREHSRVELLRKLRAKDPTLQTDEITALLDEVEARGQQSDGRFAELLVRNRISKGQGVQRIQAELRQHGMTDVLIAEAIEAIDGDERMRCQLALEKWFRRQTRPTPEKAYRFLQGKGFNFSDAQQAVGQIFR